MADDSFRCKVLNCTLSPVSCGKRWRKAEEIDPAKKLNVMKQSYVVCKGCAVGKRHANLVRDDYDASFPIRKRLSFGS